MSSVSARHRAWQALDIGPLWVKKGVDAKPNDDATTEALPGDMTEAPQLVAAGEHEPGDLAVRDRAAGAALADGLDWEALREKALGCRACGLCESRQHVVFGTGDKKPRWVVVGEAPGAQEDRQGEPFVGEAGVLLDQMLAAVGLTRDDGVFIVNVLKCRPPGNRDPLPDEVAQCRHFLDAQLAMLQPELVLAAGRFAAHTLLGETASLGALRVREHTLQIGHRVVPVVVTYHPAYYLRRPEQKNLAWQDLLRAKRLLLENSEAQSEP